VYRTWLDRAGVAIGFAGTLALAGYLVNAQAPAVRASWLAWASTSLANLADHPTSALVASAFVGPEHPGTWCALALVGLITISWTLGAWRAALLVITAHVLGTYVSEGVLAVQIHTGAVAASQFWLTDVGPSYIVVAALVAGVGYGRWPGRLLCLVGFALVAPGLFTDLGRLEVAAVGHLCSVIVALVMGWLLRRDRRFADITLRDGVSMIRGPGWR
jgi:hypothetical protein